MSLRESYPVRVEFNIPTTGAALTNFQMIQLKNKLVQLELVSLVEEILGSACAVPLDKKPDPVFLYGGVPSTGTYRLNIRVLIPSEGQQLNHDGDSRIEGLLKRGEWDPPGPGAHTKNVELPAAYVADLGDFSHVDAEKVGVFVDYYLVT